MSRDVYYDKNAKCDECGAVGAFDFMGDYICMKCANKAIEEACDEITEDENTDIRR